MKHSLPLLWLIVIGLSLPCVAAAQTDSSSLFRPKHEFKDYTAKVYKKKIAPLDWSSNASAFHFKAILENSEHDSANFAGHYRIVEWGCGDSCLGFMIVDVSNGKIYDGLVTTHGVKYHADSRMLIVDPPDDNGRYEPTAVVEWIPTIYEWKGNKLCLVERAKK